MLKFIVESETVSYIENCRLIQRFLREMNPTKDHIYNGYVLSVTIIEKAYSWIPSIHFVIEDENLDCERMFIYSFSEGQGEYLTNKVYTIGSKMNVINPHLRLGANDMKPLIRIDNFPSIIMQNESERVINVDVVANLMHHMFVANVSKRIIVQENANPWIGNYININSYVKTNDYDLWIS